MVFKVLISAIMKRPQPFGFFRIHIYKSNAFSQPCLDYKDYDCVIRNIYSKQSTTVTYSQ